MDNNKIDIEYDFYKDTPRGGDPDKFSSTLRRYHKILWSKNLPSGPNFELDESIPYKLYHKSEIGEFILSSDCFGNTYSKREKMSSILESIPSEEIDSFYKNCCTIGSYIIFPGNRIGNNMTINQSRGMNKLIGDRFDLTLECIKRFYVNEKNPLEKTLQLYRNYFELFKNFKGFIEFFLLQDFVEKKDQSIKFFLPFDNFESNPLPQNTNEYILFMEKLKELIRLRGIRISNEQLTLKKTSN
jgi:hypothetical protein